MEKLPPAWRDFKNYLKHKCEELKLEDLIVWLQIEENNHKSKKRSNKNSYESKANVIEDTKRKVSTSKSLKRKKTAQGYKGKDQEGKKKHFKELTISAKKRDTRRMNIAVVLKRTRRTIHRQT